MVTMFEYLTTHLWQMWLIIAFACLIMELSMGDFFITCFALGALAASCVSPFAGFYAQLFVFAVVSALSIFFVRPVALRYLHRGEEQRLSNADALLGRTGRVVEPIGKGVTGRVAIDGDVWKAVAADNGATFDIGTQVRVVARESITLTVESK